jgi:hypothetical protein
MATITATAGRPTTPGEIRWFPMAATQTFKRGEFVYLNNSGLLTVCASDPAGIAGMAMADAVDCGGGTTTTGVACPVTLAKRGQQFTLNCTSAGSAQVTGNIMLGHQAGLYVASNIHYCDYGDQSNRVFVIDDIAQDNVLGDTYGRVIVEVVSPHPQLDASTS